MSKFNLSAQITLQKPSSSNINSVLREISSAFGAVNTQVKINVDRRGFNSAIRDVRTLGKVGRETKDIYQDMSNVVANAARRFAGISIATGTFLGLARGIKNSLKEALEFEREMIKISQANDEAVGSTRALERDILSLSKAFGAESLELAKSGRLLVQAGFSARTTSKSLELLSKVRLAGTFGDMASNTEFLISVLQQFGSEARTSGQEAKFLEDVLNKVNRVSKKYAVEAEDIQTAVKKAGASFQAAGGTIDELIASFTAVRASTRESASTIANSFKTIFTRIQSKDTIDKLQSLGVELVDLDGKFVGPINAAKELARVLLTLPEKDVRFTQIAEEVGGIYQVNRLITLLKQQKLVQEALNTSKQAGGDIDKDVDKASQSLLTRLEKLRGAFFELIKIFSDSDTFKNVSNLLINIAESTIQAAKALQSLLPLLAAATAVPVAKFGGKLLGNLVGGKTKEVRLGGYARGGFVSGGSGNKDDVPALLMGGEFVVNKRDSKKNWELLTAINSGRTVSKFARGTDINTNTLDPTRGNLFSISTDRAISSVKNFIDKIVKLDSFAGAKLSKFIKKTKTSTNTYGQYDPNDKSITVNPTKFHPEIVAHEAGHAADWAGGERNINGQLVSGSRIKGTFNNIVANASREVAARNLKKSGASQSHTEYRLQDQELYAEVFANVDRKTQALLINLSSSSDKAADVTKSLDHLVKKIDAGAADFGPTINKNLKEELAKRTAKQVTVQTITPTNVQQPKPVISKTSQPKTTSTVTTSNIPPRNILVAKDTSGGNNPPNNGKNKSRTFNNQTQTDSGGITKENIYALSIGLGLLLDSSGNVSDSFRQLVVSSVTAFTATRILTSGMKEFGTVIGGKLLPHIKTFSESLKNSNSVLGRLFSRQKIETSSDAKIIKTDFGSYSFKGTKFARAKAEGATAGPIGTQSGRVGSRTFTMNPSSTPTPSVGLSFNAVSLGLSGFVAALSGASAYLETWGQQFAEANDKLLKRLEQKGPEKDSRRTFLKNFAYNQSLQNASDNLSFNGLVTDNQSSLRENLLKFGIGSKIANSEYNIAESSFKLDDIVEKIGGKNSGKTKTQIFDVIAKEVEKFSENAINAEINNKFATQNLKSGLFGQSSGNTKLLNKAQELELKSFDEFRKASKIALDFGIESITEQVNKAKTSKELDAIDTSKYLNLARDTTITELGFDKKSTNKEKEDKYKDILSATENNVNEIIGTKKKEVQAIENSVKIRLSELAIIKETTEAMSNLNDKANTLDINEGLISGIVSGKSRGITSQRFSNLGQISDIDSFKKDALQVAQPLGAKGQTLANEVVNIAQAAKDLRNDLVAQEIDKIGKNKLDSSRRIGDIRKELQGKSASFGSLSSNLQEIVIRSIEKEIVDGNFSLDSLEKVIDDLVQNGQKQADVLAKQAELSNQYLDQLEQVNSAIIDSRLKEVDFLNGQIDVAARGRERLNTVLQPYATSKTIDANSSANKSDFFGKISNSLNNVGVNTLDPKKLGEILISTQKGLEANNQKLKDSRGDVGVREKLNTENQKLANAAKVVTEQLHKLADRSEEASAIMEKIERIRAGQNILKDRATSFVLGSNEDRNNLNKQFLGLQQVVQKGTFQGLAPEIRQSVASLMDELAKADPNGKIQKAKDNAIAGDLQKFAKATGVQLDPSIINAVLNKATTQEQMLIQELRNISAQEMVAQKALADAQKENTKIMSNLLTQVSNVFAQQQVLNNNINAIIQKNPNVNIGPTPANNLGQQINNMANNFTPLNGLIGATTTLTNALQNVNMTHTLNVNGQLNLGGVNNDIIARQIMDTLGTFIGAKIKQHMDSINKGLKTP